MSPWIKRLKPSFWVHEKDSAGPFRYMFNFSRMWKLAVFLASAVVLVPLITMAFIDYRVTREAIEQEIALRTARLASNTRRTVTYYLRERRSALEFIARDNTFKELNEHDRIREVLEGLKASFGGFVDLGVIDPLGNQRTYVGPYKLEGRNYGDQEWFDAVLEKGLYISDVFLGYRKVPHMVIAVKRMLPNGSFFVLRATLDTERFQEILSQVEVSARGEACLINRKGIVQTPGRYQGEVLEKSRLPVPEYALHTRVIEEATPDGQRLLVGYAYIEETPFILTIVKPKRELMEPWYHTRDQLIGFLAVSVAVILVVILGGATYLVNRIYQADQRRLTALHQLEYSNKMATIGRLSAGVAHEINNPLAIINEKAGLIKDYFLIKEAYARDDKLLGLVDIIIKSVERCSIITRRLLDFARQTDVEFKELDIEEVVREVLDFLGKESEYRSITIDIEIPEEVSQVVSDKSKLQEILLNLFNNAFEAMEDGGRLQVRASAEGAGAVDIRVTDDGCGMSEEELKHVFEPFFTTKSGRGGTGLGLSITYGLVQKLGGRMGVESTPGKGTTFHIRLPLDPSKQ